MLAITKNRQKYFIFLVYFKDVKKIYWCNIP
jgi:hypothetical protein